MDIVSYILITNFSRELFQKQHSPAVLTWHYCTIEMCLYLKSETEVETNKQTKKAEPMSQINA